MPRWMPQRERRMRAEARRDTMLALLAFCAAVMLYHFSCPNLDGAGRVNVSNLRGAAKCQAMQEEK